MTFGLPSEPFPIVALSLGALLLFAQPARLLFERGRLAAFVLVASAAAAALSAVYVAIYLRGGPRIVDATSYFLEARALSEGKLAWSAGDPSEVGRFLVRDTLADGRRLAVIFPPGYPAVLAVGFWLGKPLWVGPALAFATTWLTAFVARAAIPAHDPRTHQLAVRLAVLLSVACGALRYHTADTMSHGLAAACVAGGLGCALRLGAGGRSKVLLGAGLGMFVGLLVSARPVSGLLLALVALPIVGRRIGVRSLASALVGAAPFIALLVLHQHAATGAWFSSSQGLYYATSDGPLGCFRYGFGVGIGCVNEHGDFVRHNLGAGYGAVEALATTLRRLKMHGVDALNAEPLAVVLLLPAFVFALARPAMRRIALLPLGIVIAYAPFYFDGNYPAGGARFFVDALPIEHVLVAWFGVFELAPRLGQAFRRASVAPETVAGILVGASLLGFAVRAHIDHEQLRDREGGRPMFERATLTRAGIQTGLVFVDTDHGFALGFDPEPSELSIARYRGDRLDWLLWNGRGRPPAFRYHYDFDTGRSFVSAFVPEPLPTIEGASLWPALSQSDGYAIPRHVVGCLGAGRSLAIVPALNRRATVTLALPAALAGSSVSPVVEQAQTDAIVVLRSASGVVRTWSAEALAGPCRTLSSAKISAEDGAGLELLLSAEGAGFQLRALAIE